MVSNQLVFQVFWRRPGIQQNDTQNDGTQHNMYFKEKIGINNDQNNENRHLGFNAATSIKRLHLTTLREMTLRTL